MQSVADANCEVCDEYVASELESFVSGAIVDSWVESAKSVNTRAHVILQVMPRGRPQRLVIVEADVSLVPDRFWLEDLSENLCHGSTVLASGLRLGDGLFAATQLQLKR